MPPPVTTGMLTAIPELLPRLIVIVLNQTEGSRAITRAGTVLMSVCSLRLKQRFETFVFSGAWRAVLSSCFSLRQTFFQLFVFLGGAAEVPDLLEKTGGGAAGF